jgi:hypothetical protein
VIKKASASAFFEIYNLLNTDDLRVRQMIATPPHRTCFSRNGCTDEDDFAPGWVTVNGTRDFGRRFQIGFQVDF